MRPLNKIRSVLSARGITVRCSLPVRYSCLNNLRAQRHNKMDNTFNVFNIRMQLKKYKYKYRYGKYLSHLKQNDFMTA
jgi:hypothetical protein